jgi:hypothetical protein
MSKIQQEVVRLLLQKKISLKKENKPLKSVTMQDLGRWQAGKNSPTLERLEDVLNDNSIDLPFFFDGTLESLVDFNKKIAEQKGFKLTLTFE